jgi:hypothetical protein
MTLQSCKAKLIRVQRIINIKIAKAYRTVSNEALFVLTVLTPITIKIEEMAKLYHLTKGNTNKKEQVDNNMEVKYWQHPADMITRMIEDTEEKSRIQIHRRQ